MGQGRRRVIRRHRARLAVRRLRVYRAPPVSENTLISTDPSAAQAPAAGPRPIGRVNWIGLRTLYLKEVWRFLKMPMYTVLAPTVTSVLFLAVFTLGVGAVVRDMAGVPLVEFLAPGLVMMAIVHSAFESPSASLIMAKLHGSIADVLTPPLSPVEFALGYVLGGATRGLVTGAFLVAVLVPFVALVPLHPAFVLFHAVAAALVLSMLGFVAGLWAEKWDQLALVTNFTIMPLTFLSGAFYSIDRLSGAWREALRFNPVFYMIDGFRYGFTGHADGSLAAGLIVMAALVAVLGLVCHRLVARGYGLRT